MRWTVVFLACTVIGMILMLLVLAATLADGDASVLDRGDCRAIGCRCHRRGMAFQYSRWTGAPDQRVE